jgi:hypothetical protein
MTRGPLHLTRRRLRRLAGFVATFLLAGHVLAATGLCMVTSRDAPAVVHDAGTPCQEHAPADPARGSGLKHHCPADEPTPQARAIDLPAAQPVAAIASVLVRPLASAPDRAAGAGPDPQVPPPPLYERLRRLRL